MVDLRQMRCFVALADTLHFGRAAQRLHMTQPPLSRQIAAIEKTLGVRLVERDSRHVALTAAGLRFADDARAVLTAAEQAERNARLAHTGELGEVHVGFMMHAAHSSVPPMTRRFTAAHPGVALRLHETFPAELPARILDGRLDAGIGFRVDDTHGLCSRVIHEEPLCVALPSAHALSAHASLRAGQLAGEPLVAVAEDVAPTLRRTIHDHLLRAGVTPDIRLETHLQQSIVSLVAEGLGIALVPSSMRRITLHGLAYRDLEDAPTIEQVIYWRRDNLNPALPRLLASLEAIDGET